MTSPKIYGQQYSFLGLYRKFCEADIYELIELTKKQKQKHVFDINTFYASFYGNSIFSIFFNDLKVLKPIWNKLQEDYNDKEELVQKDIGVEVQS